MRWWIIITIKLESGREGERERERRRAPRVLKLIAMIYRENSACRRARSRESRELSSFRWCTTRYNCCNILGAEGVADSQFNFMAYTVPPSAAAYRARHLPPPFISSAYLTFLHPLKTFLLGILETFKSLPRFPRAF